MGKSGEVLASGETVEQGIWGKETERAWKVENGGDTDWRVGESGV